MESGYGYSGCYCIFLLQRCSWRFADGVKEFAGYSSCYNTVTEFRALQMLRTDAEECVVIQDLDGRDQICIGNDFAWAKRLTKRQSQASSTIYAR